MMCRELANTYKLRRTDALCQTRAHVQYYILEYMAYTKTLPSTQPADTLNDFYGFSCTRNTRFVPTV